MLFRSGYWRAIRAEANDRDLGVLIAGGFALFFVKQGLKAYLPVFVVESVGASVSVAGLILGAYGLVRVAIAPLAGPLTARIGRKYALLAALSAIVAGIAAVPLSGTVALLVGIVSVFAAGEAIFNPALSSAVADLAGDDHRGGIMSGLASLKSLANTLSPAVLGVVLGLAGFTAMFFLAAGVGLVYGAGVFALLDRTRVDA